MSFLHNSLSRAWRPYDFINILPGRDRQNRGAQRDSSVRPESSNSNVRELDVTGQNSSPTIPRIASRAVLSVSNTLRSKARMFYVDSVQAEMDMPVKTAAERTSAMRLFSRSHISAGNLDDGHNEQQSFLELTTSPSDSHKEHQKFLRHTTSSPLRYKETSIGPNANSLKSAPVDNELTDKELPTYLGPFTFEAFRPRDLEFTSEDCNPGPCEDGASGDESSDQERFRFVPSRHASDCTSLDFSFYKGDDNGAVDRGPWDHGSWDHGSWDRGSFEGSTYNLCELSEKPASDIRHEENALAASYKAYQAYSSDSEGLSRSASGSLSAEAQYPPIEAQSSIHNQYPITKSMEDIDTDSEHESDLMTDLARFPDCLKYRATDIEEAGHKVELPVIETQSTTGQDTHSPERPFNAAKLPQFNASLSWDYVTQPSIKHDTDR